MDQTKKTFPRDLFDFQAGQNLDWNSQTLDATSGSGSGDVTGPSGAGNENIAIFDGTTGKVIKDSDISIDALSALLPTPAPDFDSIDVDSVTQEVTADLTWGASAPLANYQNVTGIGSLSAVDVDQSFGAGSESGNRVGVIQRRAIQGDMQTSNTGDPSGNDYWPAGSFDVGDGTDQGFLQILLNGTLAHNVDLDASPPSDTRDVNGTGFTGLSDATPVQFADGTPFPTYQYRTCDKWHFGANTPGLLNGWNHIQVRHTIEGRVSNYIDWVFDAAEEEEGSGADTAYSGISFGPINFDPSTKDLSGVTYYRDGTAPYQVTISNLFKNTYKTGPSITFAESNGTIPNESQGNSGGNQSLQYNVNSTFTITASRLINQNISVITTVDRSFSNTETSSSQSVISGILLDDVNSSSDAGGPAGDTGWADEDFESEDYRLNSASNFESITLDPNWDSSVSLLAGAPSGYNDGMQITEGRMYYPGNASIGDYNTTISPPGNPNYLLASGDRVYYRHWLCTSGSSSNFRFRLEGDSGWTFRQWAQSFTAPNQIKVSIKLPTQTGWMDATQSFVTNQWADGDGCLDLSGGNPGSQTNADWDVSVGTRSTFDSGSRVWLRLDVSAGTTLDLTRIRWRFK